MRSARMLLFAVCLAAIGASASVVGSVRGVIHDPQHRPVQDAMVMIKAKASDWASTANSDANGNFVFNAVPLGEYMVTVAGVGFDQSSAGCRHRLQLATRPALRAQRRRSKRIGKCH